jgi:hypothetical protein
MTERLEEELELLSTFYPDLEQRIQDGHDWVRIPSYPLPVGVWSQTAVEVAFEIPPQAGQQPYAFYVRPGLTLASSGPPDRYSPSAATPWGADWGKFSWSPTSWTPKADIRAGANMLNFARSFADRFAEGA